MGSVETLAPTAERLPPQPNGEVLMPSGYWRYAAVRVRAWWKPLCVGQREGESLIVELGNSLGLALQRFLKA